MVYRTNPFFMRSFLHLLAFSFLFFWSTIIVGQTDPFQDVLFAKTFPSFLDSLKQTGGIDEGDVIYLDASFVNPSYEFGRPHLSKEFVPNAMDTLFNELTIKYFYNNFASFSIVDNQPEKESLFVNFKIKRSRPNYWDSF